MYISSDCKWTPYGVDPELDKKVDSDNYHVRAEVAWQNYGLDKLIEFRTGVSATIAEDAVECVAKGTGEVLGYIDKLDSEVNSQQIVIIE